VRALSKEVSVEAWQTPQMFLEFYHYGPGCYAPIPRHSHAEYQIGLCLDHPGLYHYRGASHDVPVGSVSVLHPQETHVTGNGKTQETPGRNLMLFLPPLYVREVAEGMAGCPVSQQPFFSEAILDAPVLSRLLQALHAAHRAPSSALEQEGLLQSAVAYLVRHHGGKHTRPYAPEPARVQRVREYLEAHFAENTSLDTLAQIADVSPFHLCRVFKDAMGVAPHAWQTQLRITRAKQLLLAGCSPGEVAQDVGFFDQSHLLRHFRRFTGISPGRYRAAAIRATATATAARTSYTSV
jgi:AraC-like DNA-binding protein